VQASRGAVAAVSRQPRVTFVGSSTDSNLAMSLGIPAVTLGGGGEGAGWHSLGEWFKPTNAYQGPQSALLTTLVLVGLQGVSEPALAVRPPRP
jgi:tripeptide aminopeptidase